MGSKSDGVNPEDISWMDKMAMEEDRAVQRTAPAVVKASPKLPNKQHFMNSDGKYEPNKFAKWIINDKDQHYISLRDTDEVMHYKDGIYLNDGDKTIEELIVKIMDGWKITIAKSRETVFLIKRRVAHDRCEIDCDKNVINLKNGLFNIDTRKINPHTPDYVSVRMMNVFYNPDASCPKIDKFIREIVNEEDVEFIYELFGYMLITDRRFRIAVFLEGRGLNGKSVLMDLMKCFMGEDAWSDITPLEMSGEDQYARAELFGKLLNIVDDLGNDVLTGLGAFKSIVTGNDVRAQRKYGHAFTFKPTALCIFGCNEVPITTDTSDGFFSRMRCVNFPNRFEGENDDKQLIDKITTADELSGLFNKAVAAIHRVIERGHFTGNTSVEEKRSVYMAKSNPVVRFVNELCDITDANNEIVKTDLYNQYVLWAIDRNIEVKDMGNMTTTLSKIGISVSRPEVDGQRVRCYKGIDMCYVQPPSNLPSNQNNGDRLRKDSMSNLPPPIVTNKKIKEFNRGGGVDSVDIASTDGENGGGHGLDTGWTENKNAQKQMNDPDVDSKLKHAVGKAISKSDTMGAELSTIVECYPESISRNDVMTMLEERGQSLGIKEMHGKWYTS